MYRLNWPLFFSPSVLFNFLFTSVPLQKCKQEEAQVRFGYRREQDTDGRRNRNIGTDTVTAVHPLQMSAKMVVENKAVGNQVDDTEDRKMKKYSHAGEGVWTPLWAAY